MATQAVLREDDNNLEVHKHQPGTTHRLGKRQDVKEFVEKMIAVDFDLSRGGAADGMHMADCARIWQLSDLGVSQ